MSHEIDPDVSACIGADGRAHLLVQNVETARGSLHTSFDYGNNSVSRLAYEIVIPLANGVWSETSIEVLAAKFRQEKVRGTVVVAKNDLTLDLLVAARDLPNYSLVPVRGVAIGRGEAFLRAAPKCAGVL